jgi:hypothetical protein
MKRIKSKYQQVALADRQFVTSFCIIDIAECKGMFQIGDRRVLIAEPQTKADSRWFRNSFTPSMSGNRPAVIDRRYK